jgi:hypothetical protein
LTPFAGRPYIAGLRRGPQISFPTNPESVDHESRATMKTERRHELQHNELSDWLGQRLDVLRPYTTAVVALAAGLLLVVGVYQWSSSRSTEAEAGLWGNYFVAARKLNQDDPSQLQKIVEDVPSSSVAAWARLRLGDYYLARGINLLFSDRGLARQELGKAVDTYLALAIASNDDPLMRERATWGLAKAYESQNNLDKARDRYRELTDSKSYGPQARARLTDLDRSSTKQFYDWFAKQDPRPAPIDGPGTPGERPPFDLNSMPLNSETFEGSSFEQPAPTGAGESSLVPPLNPLDPLGAPSGQPAAEPPPTEAPVAEPPPPSEAPTPPETPASGNP